MYVLLLGSNDESMMVCNLFLKPLYRCQFSELFALNKWWFGLVVFKCYGKVWYMLQRYIRFTAGINRTSSHQQVYKDQTTCFVEARSGDQKLHS